MTSTADNSAPGHGSMTAFTSEVQKTLAHIEETIGARDKWANWGGGWPRDIEGALLDAVFSARAVYLSKRGRGVHAHVIAWIERRGSRASNLDALAAEIAELGPNTWARTFGNQQVSPGRPASAPGGATKAATVLQAANTLIAIGVSVPADISDDNADQIKSGLRSVPGIGYATANYFLMVLGKPGVKPDRMIHRFLENATGHAFSNAAAERVINAAAARLAVKGYELDHAIWKYESDAAAARRGQVHTPDSSDP